MACSFLPATGRRPTLSVLLHSLGLSLLPGQAGVGRHGGPGRTPSLPPVWVEWMVETGGGTVVTWWWCVLGLPRQAFHHPYHQVLPSMGSLVPLTFPRQWNRQFGIWACVPWERLLGSGSSLPLTFPHPIVDFLPFLSPHPTPTPFPPPPPTHSVNLTWVHVFHGHCGGLPPFPFPDIIPRH